VTIETHNVEDLRVYGSQVVDYAIAGERGKCFSDVLAAATIQQSYAIENLTISVSDVVSVQQTKVRELTDSLAMLVSAVTAIPTKDRKSTTASTFYSPAEMATLKENLRKYGFELELNANGLGTYGKLETMRNDVQTAVDTANNDLQRTMATLDGLLKKRDSSFQATSKIIDKNNTTAKTTIKSMGM